MDSIGENNIHPTAIIGNNVIIGKGNIIMPYAVIGQFGFIRNDHMNMGRVIIGNNNRIGSHACIQAGADGFTQIGDDNLIMNFVNIGHNCVIGDNCEIGAGTIVAGFVQIGNNVRVKIHSTIRNRKIIGNNVLIGMASNVVSSVPDDQTVMGNPAK